MKSSTYSRNRMVFSRKIRSGNSFNWLFSKYLSTNNHSECQLHNEKNLKECVLGGFIPTMKKNRVQKLTLENKTLLLNNSHVLSQSKKSRISLNCGMSLVSYRCLYAKNRSHFVSRDTPNYFLCEHRVRDFVLFLRSLPRLVCASVYHV